MRVLFVTPYYFPELKFGGPPKRIHAISRALRARGHEVRVLTFHSERPNGSPDEDFDGVPVRYVPWIGKSLRQIPVRTGILRAEVVAADVVHCYGLYNLLCPRAARWARHFSKPYFLEPMGMYVPRVASIGWKRLYHAVFTNRMARGAEAVVATSPMERDELSALGEGMNIVVRRNGIDLEEFARLPSPQIMRERWGAGPDDRVVLYLGRINKKKNLEELILAFRDAAVDRSRLVIAGPCGEPSYAARLQQLIGANEAPPPIRLEGPLYGVDHLAALAAADLFVLPSLNENFGNAAAEAVAAGVPVLLTETCGVAPIIHRRAGLAIPLGIQPLVDGIKTMLDPRAMQETTAGREEAKHDLSWDDPIRQTEDLYESALGARAGVARDRRRGS
ncbi:MAG TPA: glycosyltransferase [Chthoniobacterales bacterium]|nr:glycosyltransferase [Chthoniobacterales bacterium]